MAVHRRLLRYSFRTLMLVLLAACLAAGWLGNRIRKGNRQYIAAMAIAESGSSVLFEHYFDANGHFISGPPPNPPMPQWLDRFVDENAFVMVRKIDIGAHSMDAIVTHLPHIFAVRELNLNSVETSDAVMNAISHLSTLEALQLQSSTISDDGMAAFASLPGLQSVWLDGTLLSENGLQHLANCRRLRSLSLSSTGITDAGLKSLSNLSKLKGLALDFNEISNAGLASLKNLTELRSLSLSRTQVTADGLQHLSDLRKLRSLRLTGCDITFRESVEFFVQRQGRSVEAAFQSLGYYTSTKSSLRLPELTDADIDILSNAKKIQSLHFYLGSVSDDGIQKLVSAMPSLEHLVLGSPPVSRAKRSNSIALTDRSIEHIARLKQLKYVSVDGISKDGLARLKRLLPQCHVVSLDE